jgi:hypothetical protein
LQQKLIWPTRSPREMYEKLGKIRKLRNEFAHSTDILYFESEKIAPLFADLKKPQTTETKPSALFLLCIKEIAQHLDNDLKSYVKSHRSTIGSLCHRWDWISETPRSFNFTLSPRKGDFLSPPCPVSRAPFAAILEHFVSARRTAAPCRPPGRPAAARCGLAGAAGPRCAETPPPSAFRRPERPRDLARCPHTAQPRPRSKAMPNVTVVATCVK